MTPRTRRWAGAGLALGLVGLVIISGPRERFDEEWVEPDVVGAPDAYLRRAESGVPGIRAGDEKTLVWADSSARVPTRMAIVYLHGFSADPHEVDPLVPRLVRALGANAYIARLAGHGMDAVAMGRVGVEDWLHDAAEAVAVGSRIGERIILIGTSTGGTLALWTALRPEARDRVAALVLLSPNLQPKDHKSRMLLWPWGGAIARAVAGPERCFAAHNARHESHWTTCYPTRALLPMMALVEAVRTTDPGRLQVPTLVAYSALDKVVDPSETERWFEGTGARLIRVDEPGDPDHHVLAGDILSPAGTDILVPAIVGFVGAIEIGEGGH